MSSLMIVGFFALASGRRVSTTKSGSTKAITHCHYSTTIQCSEGTVLPADIRIFIRSTDFIHPDNTVAFIVSKVAFISPESTLLDAIFIVPMPGNIEDNSYEDTLPDFPYPLIFGLGPVTALHERSFDTVSRGFSVSVSEYVRDSVKKFVVGCVHSSL